MRNLRRGSRLSSRSVNNRGIGLYEGSEPVDDTGHALGDEFKGLMGVYEAGLTLNNDTSTSECVFKNVNFSKHRNKLYLNSTEDVYKDCTFGKFIDGWIMRSKFYNCDFSGTKFIIESIQECSFYDCDFSGSIIDTSFSRCNFFTKRVPIRWSNFRIKSSTSTAFYKCKLNNQPLDFKALYYGE